MRFRPLIAVAACAGLIAAAPAGAAEDETAGEDPVVATVNGEDIHYSEVMESAKSLPQQYQSRIKEILPALVDRLIDLKLLEDAAEDAGLADDEQVAERLQEMKPQVMRDVYLQRRVEDYITEARLKQAYEDYKAENPAKTEVRARHILLEKEDAAKAVIDELENGADFVELAKERSTGPSAKNGGDLGYFTKGDMVPAFSEAAFALEAGEHSSEPVKSQFGWHVIKVVDRRQKEPKSFEAMKGQLREEMQREAIETLLADLREDATVEKYPEAKKMGAGGGEVSGGGAAATE